MPFFNWGKETLQVAAGFGSGWLANFGSEVLETAIETNSIENPVVTWLGVIPNTLISASLTLGAAYLGYKFSGFIASKTFCPPVDEVHTEEMKLLNSEESEVKPPQSLPKTIGKEALQLASATGATLATSFALESFDAFVEVATQHHGFEWLSTVPGSFLDTGLLLSVAYVAYRSAGYIAERCSQNTEARKPSDIPANTLPSHKIIRDFIAEIRNQPPTRQVDPKKKDEEKLKEEKLKNDFITQYIIKPSCCC